MRATFLGVSSVLLRDTSSAVLTDGFLTRPGLLRCALGSVRPDEALIGSALTRLGVDRLDAVVVAHSHYDHALDAPTVARRTGAQLVGSASTAQIGAGHGLDPAQVRVATPGETLRYGSFAVTLFPAAHTPKPAFPGRIDRPLRPPSSIRSYKEGGCFSIHVDHPDGAVLVHASTNFIPGALQGVAADTVYLGVATLGRRSAQFREEYWREVVTRTGARRVVPVHWDRFWRPLSKPLKPLPFFADDFAASLRFLTERGEAEGVQVSVPTAWQSEDPFR